MTDIYDQATEAEERHRADAIANQAARSGLNVGPTLDKGRWQLLSAKWCEALACGARIPDERRRAVPGVRFCVECQVRKEKEKRQGR